MKPAVSRLREIRVSPSAYRRICQSAIWALGFIIVTGAAVRLTGSGLGCPDWPTCTGHHVVPSWHYHAWVEFGNRLVTAAVSVAVVAAVLTSVARRPFRRDLLWLSVGLFVGVAGQAVLGGLSVQHHLDPPFVMAHFLLSLILLGDAVVLAHRAGFEEGPASPLVPPSQLLAGRLLLVPAGLVMVLGTVVTSTGPHGGDPTAPRFHYALHDVARLHSSAVLLFLAWTAVTLWLMARRGAPPPVLGAGEALLAVLVVQGAVGYLQYFSGVPTWLVAIHVTLAAVTWAVALRFTLSLTTRAPAPAVDPPAPAAVLVPA